MSRISPPRRQTLRNISFAALIAFLSVTVHGQTLITSDSLLNTGSPLSSTYTAGGSQTTSVVKSATNSSVSLWMFYPDAYGVSGSSGTIVQSYTGKGSFTETINLSGLPGSGVDGYPFLLYGCDNYGDCWNGQPPQFPKQLSSISSLIVDISYAFSGAISGSRNVDLLFDQWVCDASQPTAQSNCLEVMVLPYYSFSNGTGQPLVKTLTQSVTINGSPATFTWDEWDGHPGQNMLFTPHTLPGAASQELRFDMLDLMKTATTDYGNSSFIWLMGVQPGTEFGGSSSQSYTLTINKLDIEQSPASSTAPAPPTGLQAIVQ